MSNPWPLHQQIHRLQQVLLIFNILWLFFQIYSSSSYNNDKYPVEKCEGGPVKNTQFFILYYPICSRYVEYRC